MTNGGWVVPQRGVRPVASVLAQLGVAFVLTNIVTVVVATTGRSRAGTVAASVVLAAAAFAAGLVLGRPQRGELAAQTADLCWAFSVIYLGGMVFAAAAPSSYYEAVRQHSTNPSVHVHISTGTVVVAALLASLYAVGLYVVRRRVWMQTALVAGVVTLLISSLRTYDGLPDAVVGLLLTVLAIYLAITARAGWFRPVGSGYVLAALVGGSGAFVLAGANRGVAAVVIVVLLGAVFVGAVYERRPDLLSAGAVLALVLIPRELVPDLGFRLGIGVALAGSGAAIAFTTTRLTARVLGPRPRVGGLLAVATASSLIGLSILNISDPDAGSAFGFACVAVVCVAAASAQRWWAAVLSGLALLSSTLVLARALSNSPVGAAAILVVGGAAVVTVVLARDRERTTLRQDVASAGAWRVAREVHFGSGPARVFPALHASAERLTMRVVMSDPIGGRLLVGDRHGARIDLRVQGTDAETTVLAAVRDLGDAETAAAITALVNATVEAVEDYRLKPEPHAGS